VSLTAYLIYQLASPTRLQKSFLKWLKSGEKLFKEWVQPYINKDQVQSAQLPSGKFWHCSLNGKFFYLYKSELVKHT